jgi:plasmid stability protein
VVNIQVRNVPDNVALKLNEMAAKKKMSREQFLRNYFEKMTVENDVTFAEDRYRELVNILIDRLEENNMIMEQCVQAIENGERQE